MYLIYLVATAVTNRFLLMVLGRAARNNYDVFYQVPRLRVASRLISNAPCTCHFQLNSPNYLIFCPSVVLTSVKSIRTTIISRACRGITIFLTVLLSLLRRTCPALRQSIRSTSNVVLRSRVVVPLVCSTRSLSVFDCLLVVVSRTLRVHVQSTNRISGLIRKMVLSVYTRRSDLNGRNALCHFPNFSVGIVTLVPRVTIVKGSTLRHFLVFCPSGSRA